MHPIASSRLEACSHAFDAQGVFKLRQGAHQVKRQATLCRRRVDFGL